MPGASSSRSVFTKRSDDQNVHKLLEDSPAFKRAKFWFWPIVLSVTLFFGLFAGIKGAFVGFFYGLAGGGFLLHESLQKEKK
jgi:Mg2+/citrate symporter